MIRLVAGTLRLQSCSNEAGPAYRCRCAKQPCVATRPVACHEDATLEPSTSIQGRDLFPDRSDPVLFLGFERGLRMRLRVDLVKKLQDAAATAAP